MADEALTWADGNRYINQFGGEEHLAARIKAERERREWSQSELARQLLAIGHPVPQTAISKIENPPRGGRRAISVDELISFAKVFDLPVGELVLPPDVLRAVRGRAAYARLHDAQQELLQAQDRYEGLLHDVALAARDEPEFLGDLERTRAEVDRRRLEGRRPRNAPAHPSVIHDVFETLEQISGREVNGQ